MISSGVPSAFFKGLKEEYQRPAAITNENITMLKSIRWVMKKYGKVIEIKRADTIASTMLSIQLVKFDKNNNPMKSEFDLGIADHKVEKGLFELEKKVMEHAQTKPTLELSTVLEMLRKNELTLPPHNDLRNEIIMKNHIVRVGHVGVDQNSEKDLFVGCLLLDGKTVVSSEPKTRMGYVLDDLENALFAMRREAYRKQIADVMLKVRASAGSSASSFG